MNDTPPVLLIDQEECEIKAKTALINHQRAVISDLRKELDDIQINHTKLWIELLTLEDMSVWQFFKFKRGF